ncbi:HK97 gp10 family phage protein [Metabacillus fastidiosus]|uniref:HK97 gp10 family phage protein n=1 Tax=Metabacillus fastidiosus TaxID=1458 RepID=UPI003D269A41
MSSINSLAGDIVRSLRQYTQEVTNKIEDIQTEVADNLVDDLKHTSPEKTGAYRRGWRAKRVGNKMIIHNATHYQLTHLLEKGHAKVNGGRVPARVHIRPAEHRAIDDFLTRVEQVISQ